MAIPGKPRGSVGHLVHSLKFCVFKKKTGGTKVKLNLQICKIRPLKQKLVVFHFKVWSNIVSEGGGVDQYEPSCLTPRWCLALVKPGIVLSDLLAIRTEETRIAMSMYGDISVAEGYTIQVEAVACCCDPGVHIVSSQTFDPSNFRFEGPINLLSVI